MGVLGAFQPNYKLFNENKTKGNPKIMIGVNCDLVNVRSCKGLTKTTCNW